MEGTASQNFLVFGLGESEAISALYKQIARDFFLESCSTPLGPMHIKIGDKSGDIYFEIFEAKIWRPKIGLKKKKSPYQKMINTKI